MTTMKQAFTLMTTSALIVGHTPSHADERSFVSAQLRVGYAAIFPKRAI
jgi:hypothetical protein